MWDGVAAEQKWGLQQRAGVGCSAMSSQTPCHRKQAMPTRPLAMPAHPSRHARPPQEHTEAAVGCAPQAHRSASSTPRARPPLLARARGMCVRVSYCMLGPEHTGSQAKLGMPACARASTGSFNWALTNKFQLRNRP